MYFKISEFQETELLNLPETGMGYQVIEARKSGDYSREKFLVLNSEVVIEVNSFLSDNIRKVIKEGIDSIKKMADIISLYSVSVLDEDQFRMVAGEPRNKDEKGAIDNPMENASGDELFVRLSAFDNDRRIDKKNKCLLPGSFATTNLDYMACKKTNDDPAERYALPNDDEIKFAFYILPIKNDTLQRGIVQPANGKRGGGIEAFFANGTTKGTFLLQTAY